MITVPAKYAGQAAVSPAEAAEIYGVSTATLYRRVMPHVYSGTILSFKVGRLRRIIVTSLLDFAEQETRKGEV